MCESGDIFTQEEGGFVAHRSLPEANVGDYFIIGCAGAYSYAMSSNYNSRLRAAEVLVTGRTHRLIRRRETFRDLVACEDDCLT